MTKQINTSIFPKFLKSSSAGGILLLVCVALSLLIANTAYGPSFQQLLEMPLGTEAGGLHLRYPVLLWINDGLMAVFFLLVGLEIKREVAEGELSSLKQAALPVMAALGGVALPALIFILVNSGNTQAAAGWGIPMATDIAFALAILSLVGRRAPAGLKVFLAALAIADDLIAILVIAIFYSSSLQFGYLAMAGVFFALQWGLNKLGVKSIWAYIVPGIVMWYFIHQSGIHATIAGVLTAITLPVNDTSEESPLEKLEHALTIPVNFIVMPVFALANTNITFESGMVEGLAGKLGLGILLGMAVGKPVGIFLASYLSVRSGIGELPAATKWKHILGAGMLGGIGFTMAIFIALLSFDDAVLQTEAKFAILVASLLSGCCGYATLRLGTRNS